MKSQQESQLNMQKEVREFVSNLFINRIKSLDFQRFYYPKYLSRSPLKALPCLASSLAIS